MSNVGQQNHPAAFYGLPVRMRRTDVRDPARADGRCRTRGCHMPCRAVTDHLGRVCYLPCERCARLAAGRCHTCNRPLSTWRVETRRRWCASCAKKRVDPVKLTASKRRYYAGQRSLERARAAAYDATDHAIGRRKKAATRKVASLAAGKAPRATSTLKQRACPNPYGLAEGATGRRCRGIMEFRTRPPKHCEGCWSETARRRAVTLDKHLAARKARVAANHSQRAA